MDLAKALLEMGGKSGAKKSLNLPIGMSAIENMPNDDIKKTANKRPLNEDVGDVEAFNDSAKAAYYRQKLMGKMAEKNPKMWHLISEKWSELAKDPTTHNSQARQRVSFDLDKGNTRLTNDELRAALGLGYDEFQKLRMEQGFQNNGVSDNSAKEMESFGFDDLASIQKPSSWEDRSRGLYYKPEYDGEEVYIDTNVPSLKNLVKKKQEQIKNAVAKQAP